MSKCPEDDDIKAAFRKMSLQNHPDKVGGGTEATNKFNEIKDAKESFASTL